VLTTNVETIVVEMIKIYLRASRDQVCELFDLTTKIVTFTFGKQMHSFVFIYVCSRELQVLQYFYSYIY